MKKEQFNVTGMTCAACSARVEKAVGRLPGVDKIAVNLLKNRKKLRSRAKPLNLRRLRQMILRGRNMRR